MFMSDEALYNVNSRRALDTRYSFTRFPSLSLEREMVEIVRKVRRIQKKSNVDGSHEAKKGIVDSTIC